MPYLSEKGKEQLGLQDDETYDFRSATWKAGGINDTTSGTKRLEKKGRGPSKREIGQFFEEATERLQRILTPNAGAQLPRRLLVFHDGQEREVIVGQSDSVDLKLLNLYLPGKREDFSRWPIQERVDVAMMFLHLDHFVTTMFGDDGKPSPYAAEHHPYLKNPFLYEYFGLTPNAVAIQLLGEMDGKYGSADSGNAGRVRIETMDYPETYSLSSIIEDYNEMFQGDNVLPPIISVPGRFYIADNGKLMYSINDDFITPHGGPSNNVTVMRRRDSAEKSIKGNP